MPSSVIDRLIEGSEGKRATLDEVMPIVYADLRRLADSYMRRERDSHTLQPTALVNEVYLRLIGQRNVDWRNRAQLLGVAAQMMRRVLATYSKQRRAEKRGGQQTLLSLEDVPEPAISVVPFDDLDRALEKLAALDARQARGVELRLFGGLTFEEIAEVLEVSLATVQRDWASARLWVARELQGPFPQ